MSILISSVAATDAAENQILSELQTKKSLFTSLFYSTLSHREMNQYISHMLMWIIESEKITKIILNGIEADIEEESIGPTEVELSPQSNPQSNLCPGSGIEINPNMQEILCYCGIKFKRRLKSFHPWCLPPHGKNKKIDSFTLSHTSSSSGLL